MEIITNLENNVLEIKLIDRLDTTTAPALEEVIKESFNKEFNELIFNFEKLDYLSSAGLRVMLSCQKKINELNRKMKVINVIDEIKEVFAITGFTDIIKIEEE